MGRRVALQLMQVAEAVMSAPDAETWPRRMLALRAAPCIGPPDVFVSVDLDHQPRAMLGRDDKPSPVPMAWRRAGFCLVRLCVPSRRAAGWHGSSLRRRAGLCVAMVGSTERPAVRQQRVAAGSPMIRSVYQIEGARFRHVDTLCRGWRVLDRDRRG